MRHDKANNANDSVLYMDLPEAAFTRYNKCNLPSNILGSLSFQNEPLELKIDCLHELYKKLFERLSITPLKEKRTHDFLKCLIAHFSLDKLSEVGFSGDLRLNRSKIDYRRVIRGWHFNSDSTEGAVLKGWVESRFGLYPRYHIRAIRSVYDDSYTEYLISKAKGLYNTNALESQLDLIYSYCQYELQLKYTESKTIKLYRGINKLESFEIKKSDLNREFAILFNNINSFSVSKERAEEFGDYVLETQVPISKIFFYNSLFPELLDSEEEYIAIGGLYRVCMTT